jgi:hypothetical protein
VFEPVNLDVEEDEEDEGDEPEDEEPGAGVVVRVDLPGNKKLNYFIDINLIYILRPNEPLNNDHLSTTATIFGSQE